MSLLRRTKREERPLLLEEQPELSDDYGTKKKSWKTRFRKSSNDKTDITNNDFSTIEFGEQTSYHTSSSSSPINKIQDNAMTTASVLKDAAVMNNRQQRQQQHETEFSRIHKSVAKSRSKKTIRRKDDGTISNNTMETKTMETTTAGGTSSFLLSQQSMMMPTADKVLSRPFGRKHLLVKHYPVRSLYLAPCSICEIFPSCMSHTLSHHCMILLHIHTVYRTSVSSRMGFHRLDMEVPNCHSGR